MTDTPCRLFYRELLSAYPEAKVILTKRSSIPQWHASFCETILPLLDTYYRPTWNPFLLVYRFFVFWDGYTAGDRVRAFLIRYTHHATHRQDGVRYYKEFNEEIERIVPKEKLLVFEVKEGWDPLCKFLEKEVPRWPFPRVNDREFFIRGRETREGYIRLGAMMSALKVGSLTVAVAAASIGIYWRWMAS